MNFNWIKIQINSKKNLQKFLKIIKNNLHLKPDFSWFLVIFLKNIFEIYRICVWSSWRFHSLTGWRKGGMLSCSGPVRRCVLLWACNEACNEWSGWWWKKQPVVMATGANFPPKRPISFEFFYRKIQCGNAVCFGTRMNTSKHCLESAWAADWNNHFVLIQ